MGVLRWFGAGPTGDSVSARGSGRHGGRLDGHRQSAYGALGLPPAELAELEVARSGRGLAVVNWNEQPAYSPPSEPLVVNVSDERRLLRVSRARAEPAQRDVKAGRVGHLPAD